MPTYLREDQATISVDIPDLPGNLPQVKSWTSLMGGDLESADVKTRPGGMVGQINLGGPTTRTDATVTRPYTNELHPHIVDLENIAGTAHMTIHYSILDTRGNVVGKTVAMTGILKNVTRPQFDANAENTAMLTLVMGCDVVSSIG